VAAWLHKAVPYLIMVCVHSITGSASRSSTFAFHLMQQQDETVSRPTLSAADDTVLNLILAALGENHYLNASTVCKAWITAYGVSVSQSKLTCCKPYVQNAAMWMYIKELGLHESIPAELIGHFACDAVISDRLDNALD
jgi:hypothetical protein